MIHKLSEKMPQRVHKFSIDDPRIRVRKSTYGESPYFGVLGGKIGAK
jgi:hypothetical protein